MAEINQEEIVMNLIVDGGNGRSSALKAIDAAKENNFELAEQLLKESNASLLKAHNYQTQLIQDNLGEQSDKVSLIMVHGQDHLMTAMLAYDIATKMIDMYKTFYQEKGGK